MNSLEKIRDIKSLINEVYYDSKCQGELTEGARKSWLCFKQYCDDIKQDLERLEQLEKALDKACERLDWDCPVSQDLIDDLDCDNCNDDCKECWKKYFLNLADVEVLE